MKTGTFKRAWVPGFLTVVLMFCCGLAVHAQEAAPAKPVKYRSLFDQDLLQRGLVDMELVNDRSLKNRTSFLVQGICRGTKPLKVGGSRQHKDVRQLLPPLLLSDDDAPQ